jgi:hypothetical protein
MSGRLFCSIAAALLATACATPQKGPDWAALRAAKPASILVLPPNNQSPDVIAPWAVLAQATVPLAESGYYVLPVALVAETFKQNGLTQPAEMHAVALPKLREIFGADAALYITVTRYGASYQVLSSAAVVSASAKLVDLRDGTLLWQGAASASSAENQSQNQGGIVGLLVTAVVQQILNNVTDASWPVAGVMSQRLLTAGRPGGLLYGPRSPKYGSD